MIRPLLFSERMTASVVESDGPLSVRREQFPYVDRVWDLRWPVLTKAEVDSLAGEFEAGGEFSWNEPLNNDVVTASFADDSLKVIRRSPTHWEATVRVRRAGPHG